MASGSSSGRVNSGGSKGFEFASDEVLCSFEDYVNHDSSNGYHADPVIGASSSNKDFHKTRMARSSVFPSAVHNQLEDSFGQDVMSAVEKSMKKYADNLMRFLEGISSRLSQLELYCYNLDKSIGGMRHELSRDNGEADEKLKSLEKHIQEVHRSVQILRDKQELAETQKELAKLQLAKKDSTSSSHSQSYDERAPCSASNLKKFDYKSEAHNQQLALALPQQVAPQQQRLALPPPPAQAPPQTQQQSYSLPPTQLPTQSTQTQHPQSQYIPDPQYHTPQLQDTARVAPPTPTPTHPQINQMPSAHYQQQWPQQFNQQAPPLPATIQQPSVQPQMRPPPTAVYSHYASNQPANAPHPDTHSSSITMSMPYPGVPQPGSSQVDVMPYGYNGAGRPVQQPQPPPQQVKGNFRGQQNDGYVSTGPHPALPPPSTYMMYVSEATRTRPSQSPNYQGGYPPENAPLPNIAATSGSGLMLRNPIPSQFVRSHPYSELIEKFVSMGFRGDHVASVIQRMEEDGQAVDFNSVLDRLNAHSSGGPQRGW